MQDGGREPRHRRTSSEGGRHRRGWGERRGVGAVNRVRQVARDGAGQRVNDRAGHVLPNQAGRELDRKLRAAAAAVATVRA